MKPVMNLAAAFVAGAAAVVLLDKAWRSRRTVDAPMTDAQLRERVRSRMELLVSHPEAIDVEVERGLVRVSGHVLSSELDGLLSGLTGMPGVHKVHNALSSHRDEQAFTQSRPSLH